MALNAGQRVGGIRVTYRASGGAVVDTTLDRLRADEVIARLPVREFRWHEGRHRYSGWYWCATGQRLVVYESRLELARIMLADFDPAVTAVAAQPFRLVGRDGRRQLPVRGTCRILDFRSFRVRQSPARYSSRRLPVQLAS